MCLLTPCLLSSFERFVSFVMALSSYLSTEHIGSSVRTVQSADLSGTMETIHALYVQNK
jgi:hypothetical protein